ncbi:unnamed protein product [Arctogadus glacialis]
MTSTMWMEHAERDRYVPSLSQVNGLQEVCGSGGESSLDKEARKWASKVAKDYKIISHGTRALQSLESRVQLLPKETGLSVEQRMLEVEETIRKAKVSRVRAEARLALLEERGLGVEQWLGPALRQAHEELEGERTLSEQRRSTGDGSEEEFDLTDLEDFEEEDGDIFVDLSSASVVCLYPAACRVVYDYQARQSDELSIVEGEELQVIEEGDVEDWLKVCNSCGQVGYVPERYVQFLCLPTEDSVQLDCSFSSCFSIGNIRSGPSSGMARALYTYQAQSAEELSFQEGALIRLLRCGQGEVDDGFWEGELDGRVGVFPSLVVELLSEDGGDEDEDETPPTPTCSPPGPSYSPPPPVPPPSLAPAGPYPHPQPRTHPPLVSALSGGQGVRTHALDTEPQRTTDSPAEAAGGPHASPGRFRPCRAPPPPPTQRILALALKTLGLKTLGLALKTLGLALKTLGLKTLGLALKTLGLALKTLGLALKTLGLALKTLTLGLALKTLALKTLGLALKTLALKTLGLALKTLGLALKTLGLKTLGLTLKTLALKTLALKTLGLALKTLGLKTLGLALKTLGLKTLGLALKTLGLALKTLGLKTLGLALKTLGLALKTLGLALKTLALKTLALKTLGLKTLGLALKTLGLALKTLGLALKTLGLALKTLGLALKILGLALMTLGLALMTLGLALKTLGLALKILAWP